MPDRTIFIRPTVSVDAAAVTPHPSTIDFQNGAVRVQQDPTDAGVVQVRVGLGLNTNVTLGTETTLSVGAGNSTTLRAGDAQGAALNPGGDIILQPGFGVVGGAHGQITLDDQGVAMSVLPTTTNLVTLGSGSLALATVFTRIMQADAGQNLLIRRQDGLAVFTITSGSSVTVGNHLIMADGIALNFGSSNDVVIDWGTTNANAAFVIAIGVNTAAQSGNVILTTFANRDQEHGLAAMAQPRLNIFSAADMSVAGNRTQYIQMYHDGAQGVVRTGSGAELQVTGTTSTRLTWANPDTGTKELFIEGGAGGNVLIDGVVGNQQFNVGTSGVFSHYRFRLGGATSEFSLQDASGDVFKVLATVAGSTFSEWTQPANTSGTPKGLLWTAGAHAGLDNANLVDIDFALDRTVNLTGGGAGFDHYRGIQVQPATLTADAAQTIANPATVYIGGAPVASTNVTATNGPYSLFVDDGLTRLDGDGTHVLEVPTDATDPTGGAVVGRLVVVQQDGTSGAIPLYAV